MKLMWSAGIGVQIPRVALCTSEDFGRHDIDCRTISLLIFQSHGFSYLSYSQMLKSVHIYI